MSKINVLPSSVFNRISAGEVVERPCSVAKELIENAIDAGATEIDVTVTNGGTELIEVTDNGSGISYDDLKKAFLPHATSKIADVEDLDRILTLGFRGEALASIGAVSKSTIISKTEDVEAGGMIRCYGGSLSDVEYFPCKKGTKILVEDLFYNTPVRAKFLKVPKSEEAEISNIVCRMMLSKPEISFTYTLNDKVIFQTYGDGLESAMINVYGYEVINNCFYIETQKNGISIKGYIGKHNYLKSNRTYQTLLVNGRYVINSTVNLAITNAYSSYLMKRQYPFYVLNIDMPSEFVDVNVHPNKADVRFQNNQVVYSTIYSVISSVLDGTSQALDIVKIDLNKDEDELKKQRSIIEENKNAVNATFTVKDLVKPYREQKGKNNPFSSEFDKPEPKRQETQEQLDVFAQNKLYIEKLEKAKAEQLKIEIEDPLIFIGQAFNTFLIYQKKDNLYIVDQHAAHERLLYDKMLNFSNANIISQPLLVPFTIKPNPLEEQTLFKIMPYVKNLGIVMEKSYNDTYVVTMVPVELMDMDFKKFVDDLTQENLEKCDTPTMILEKLMQKACKHAIKAGYKLSKTEIDVLTKKLNDNLGLKCPHGRPVAVKITKTEIYKWFKRIV